MLLKDVVIILIVQVALKRVITVTGALPAESARSGTGQTSHTVKETNITMDNVT